MSTLERARDRHLANYNGFAAGLGKESALVSTIRQYGARAFRRQGIPSRKLENWRYTNLAPLAKLELAPVSPKLRTPAPPPAGLSLGDSATRHFTLHDGHFTAGPETEAPRDEGVQVQGLARLRQTEPEQAARLLSNTPIDEHPFAALNTAFLDDGALIRAPRGVFDERTIQLVVAAGAYPDPRVSHPRVLVVAEPMSHLTLVLDFMNEGDGPGFTNAVTELHLAEDAEVHLVIVQREHSKHFHIGGVFVHQERGSRFSCHTLSLGGALLRNDLSVQLAGEGAISNLQGLFVARESSVADNHTRVDHSVPHCESHELYKGIIGQGGRGVFHGHVIVQPDAQQTLAEQRNPNLLLGEMAEIDTRPQLEINADDVRCSHGSTIGQLDTEALFYLQSRGIEESGAREILTRAFAEEILATIPIPELRESLEPFVAEELAGLRGN